MPGRLPFLLTLQCPTDGGVVGLSGAEIFESIIEISAILRNMPAVFWRRECKQQKMRTTESETSAMLSGWARLRRDLAVLISLAKMIFYYWTVGGRIRKGYRECQARGEIYWVDEEPAETKKRLR